MEMLGIDLEKIHTYICKENRCCIMRANPSVEHIFSEMYHVREKRKAGYMKVKIGGTARGIFKDVVGLFCFTLLRLFCLLQCR